jgi:hypothetical protein
MSQPHPPPPGHVVPPCLPHPRLPEHLAINKMGEWPKLAGEVSVQLHAALAKQLRRDDFTVCARFGMGKQCGGKQRHSVTATAAW